MRYPLLVLAVLGVLLLTVWRPLRRANTTALMITAAGLLFLTAVFDNVMIAAGFFRYAPDTISGLSVGLAPIEDFSYPLAAAVILPALWHGLARRGSAASEKKTADRVGFRRSCALILSSSRPVSWINTAFPFAAAYLFSTGNLDWVLVLGALFFLVPYNVAMYGINDVFDYASDINNPRKGGIEGSLLPPQIHRSTLVAAAMLCLPFAVFLYSAGGVWTAITLTISLFAVVAYSMAGLRFKERPFLDSITSSTHFVSPAVVGFALGADAGFALPDGVPVILSAFFLWGMAAHAFGAVQDVVPDRSAGMGSIATVLGARWTVRFSVLLWITAGLLMLAVHWPGPLAALLVVPYLVISLPWWDVTDASSARVNASWRRFLWLNYAAGAGASIILITAW